MKKLLLQSLLAVSILLISFQIPIKASVPNIKSLLPYSSTAIKNVGNNWFTFQWNGETFLVRIIGQQIICLSKL